MASPLLPICLALLAATALPAAARASVDDEIVVMRDGGLTRAERAQAGVSTERDLPLAGVEVVSAGDDRGAALAALRTDPDVEWAEPNRPRRLSGEPLAGLLWALNNTGQSVWWRRGTPDADIDAPQAWAISRGAGLTVAVADTGIDAGHPDLAGRVVPGYDFVDDDADPRDEHGHGTHVAGTIAAAENGAGVIGVAPQALIMPLRVLDEGGGGNSADVAAAFAFAGDRGVPVVNASLGSSYPSLVERRAIQDHPGTLYVVAAGNGGPDGIGDDNDGATREYPCAHDEPNLICVGATDSNDARAAFSNYGATTVDLFAPGQDIVSSWARGHATVLNQYFGTGDGYEIMQGTSMAAPHVAGAAALAAAVHPGLSGSRLKAVLMDGADRRAGLAGISVSGGRLNAAASVRIAAALPPEPGPDAGPLGPELPALGEAGTQEATVSDRVRAPRPRISGVRVDGTPRVCRRRGCQARAATLSFLLAAEADVTVRLQPRRCVRTRCRWRPARTRSRRAPAGRTRWVVGQSLLGMTLRRGRWRVTLVTSAGRVRRVFRVR
jgi:subtilisin family serine protease